MKALSIRQPWAWLIVNGHKYIENRTWLTHFRGPVLVHASKGMTRAEYWACARFLKINRFDVILPAFEELERGGIVGSVEIVDCVDTHKSKWFWGPYGFTLRKAKVLPFVAVKGSLGFFNVNEVT